MLNNVRICKCENVQMNVMKYHLSKFKASNYQIPESAHLHIRTSAHQFFIFIVLICLNACSESNKQNIAPLFDLKKYFESQITLLKQSNPQVQKLVIQNGQAESKDMEIADWSMELKPFLESDISKPALRNSYRVDTADASISACHVVYVAIDSSQSVRKVDLITNKNAITQIAIQKNTGSRLLQSTQSLTWTTGVGYVISGNQTITLGKENEYAIKVTFLK